MEDLRVVFASNLIAQRTKAGMTQAELGGRINYSDKSVSKWERAEALPDVSVVKNIADIFGVSVDYMLNTHDQWEPPVAEREEAALLPPREFSRPMIAGVALASIWTLAILLFVIFWILGHRYWVIFISTIPVSLTVLLAFNCIWNRGRHNFPIVASIILGIFWVIYYVLRSYRPWQLFLVLIPAELVAAMGFRIRRTGRGRKRDLFGK